MSNPKVREVTCCAECPALLDGEEPTQCDCSFGGVLPDVEGDAPPADCPLRTAPVLVQLAASAPTPCKHCKGSGVRDHDCGDSTCGVDSEPCSCGASPSDTGTEGGGR